VYTVKKKEDKIRKYAVKFEVIEIFLFTKGMTQKEFSKKVGLTQQHISKLKNPEKHSVFVGPKVRERILETLGKHAYEEVFYEYKKGGND
jgi:transcriptional regulator with XRE-family HTH domain